MLKTVVLLITIWTCAMSSAQTVSTSALIPPLKTISKSDIPSVSPSHPVASTVEAGRTSGQNNPSRTDAPVDTVIVSKLPEISMHKDWSDWATLCFGLLLVAVGGLQAVVILRQTNLIEKQADLMERQTRIQEASMNQWVHFENWQTKNLENENDLALDISFQLVNPTSHTLTLTHGELKQSMMPNTMTVFVYRRTPLPPNRPLTFTLTIPLTALRMNTFRTSTMGFGIEGLIIFESVLGEQVEQYFSGLVTCNRETTKFESHIVVHQHDESA